MSENWVYMIDNGLSYRQKTSDQQYINFIKLLPRNSINPLKFYTLERFNPQNSLDVYAVIFSMSLLPAVTAINILLTNRRITWPLWEAVQLLVHCFSGWNMLTADLQEVASPYLHLYWCIWWAGREITDSILVRIKMDFTHSLKQLLEFISFLTTSYVQGIKFFKGSTRTRIYSHPLRLSMTDLEKIITAFLSVTQIKVLQISISWLKFYNWQQYIDQSISNLRLSIKY